MNVGTRNGQITTIRPGEGLATTATPAEYVTRLDYITARTARLADDSAMAMAKVFVEVNQFIADRCAKPREARA